MSGFNNFISNNPGGPPGPGGAGGLPPIPMGGMTKQGADPTEIMINYNERFKDADPAQFREQLIALTMSVLISRSKPNPLLGGSAGVGKTRIVEEIARLIANGSPAVPPQLAKSTIWELPLSSIVAGGGIVGEIEERMVNIIEFASDPANDAILFIDEIHLLQSRDSTYTKIAQILKPALARGDMRLIGATTGQESRKLDDDPAFARRFSSIIVSELTREQTVEVLHTARDSFQDHYRHQVILSDDLLVKIATIADENSKASARRPDNALTLLDRAMGDTIVRHSQAIAEAETNGDTVLATTLKSAIPLSLSETAVKRVAVKLMTGMPTKQTFSEASIRASLSRLKGQDQILNDLIDALRRDDLSAFPRRQPLAWMLAGPSGVGKTEATKAISEALTGQPPIMLNMAEYDTRWSASKLLGSPPGYVGSESNRELPFDTLESNPYRVILLDEVEKADRSIHQLLLSALDEGQLRMASGKIVDFSKAVFIATTNAARESMGRTPLGFSASNGPKVMSRQELVKALQDHFAAEFLGRFTKLVAFHPITKSVYREILIDYYEDERARIIADNPRRAAQLPVSLDATMLDEIVEDTYLVDQGARPARVAGRKLIEDLLLAPVNKFPAPVATNDDDVRTDDDGPDGSDD